MAALSVSLNGTPPSGDGMAIVLKSTRQIEHTSAEGLGEAQLAESGCVDGTSSVVVGAPPQTLVVVVVVVVVVLQLLAFEVLVSLSASRLSARSS